MVHQSRIAHGLTSAPVPRPRRRWRRALGAALAALVLVAGLGGALSYFDPAFAPALVDTARALFGPQPVAFVESLGFQAQDTVNAAPVQATGAAKHVERAAPPTTHIATPAHSASAPAPEHATPAPRAATASRPSPAQHPSDVAWSPFVSAPGGDAVLERALVVPDPDRAYAEAALVRIDLRAARIHLVAGTQEPISSVRFPRPGSIPLADQRSGKLLAAFNGGFKAANGGFGMGLGATTLLPPIDGVATLALYRDGHVAIGAWGADVNATPDLIAFRQNCPLLLEGGIPTDAARSDDATLWGKTVGNKIATARSGLGISADGRYLIYAAGDSLTVPALAQALASAGAARAMQLDINSWWTRFVTYTPDAGGRLRAQKLLTSMDGDGRQFLAPDSRDFIYVTAD
jgi:hypothetical protein